MNPPQRCVLVVDDESAIHEAITGYLSLAGFRAVAAESVSDAIALLESESIDIVVVDLLLGKQDGRDIVRHMRRIGLDVPSIVITAHGGPTAKENCLQLGVDLYLEKPFSLRVLGNHITDLIKLRESGRGSK